MKEIQTVKSSLNIAFAIKDLGQLKFILGLEIARTKKGIHARGNMHLKFYLMQV